MGPSPSPWKSTASYPQSQPSQAIKPSQKNCWIQVPAAGSRSSHWAWKRRDQTAGSGKSQWNWVRPGEFIPKIPSLTHLGELFHAGTDLPNERRRIRDQNYTGFSAARSIGRIWPLNADQSRLNRPQRPKYFRDLDYNFIRKYKENKTSISIVEPVWHHARV